MKINFFNTADKISASHKKNINTCFNIFNDLIKNKENFFLDTLSDNYQKNIHLEATRPIIKAAGNDISHWLDEET